MKSAKIVSDFVPDAHEPIVKIALQKTL